MTSMLQPALLFFISLGGCYLIACHSRRVQRVTAQFSSFLLRNAFPSTSGYEHVKFGLLRIIFGYLLLNKAFQIHIALLPSEHLTALGLWSIANVIAALFVTFGFLTQWSLLFLMFAMWHFGDWTLKTVSLSNFIAGVSATLFFLTNAGKCVSIDQFIVTRFKKLTAWLFYYQDIPSRESIALSKFIALFGYGMVCMYSLLNHLDDDAWMTGVAGPYILSNNFMTSCYTFFVDLFETHSWAVYAGRVALWWMMLWYPIIVPFTLLGGAFRAYVIYWGIAFFIFSSFVLMLGSAAELEFILWPALFWAKTGLTKKNLGWLGIPPQGTFLPSNRIPSFGVATLLNSIFLSVFFVMYMPHITLKTTDYCYSDCYKMHLAAGFYGMGRTDVFNTLDLRMAENWYTLTDVKNATIVPIMSAQGSRLSMHRSDRVYFGNTVAFRRWGILHEGCLFNDWHDRIDYLAKVYLHKIDAPIGLYTFKYTQYHQTLPDTQKLLRGEFVQSPIQTLCNTTFDVNYAQ